MKIAVLAGAVSAVTVVAALLAVAVAVPADRITGTPNKPATAPTAANVYERELIRFHVLANSDSAKDQALKRRIRDLVVARMSPEFRKAASIGEARQIALAHLNEIKTIAEQECRNWGEDYPVRVQYGKFDFPVRTYGKLTVPAGTYEAVRVVVGRGRGANWWCVLFPPLCFVDVSRAFNLMDAADTATTVYSCGPDGSRSQIEQPESGPDDRTRVEVRFKLLELLARSFD